MVSLAAVFGFLVALLPLVLTPGASFTLVSARGLNGDHRGAAATIAGTGFGILTHAALAGAGLAMLVMQSAQLYAAVRLLGAAYLVGLGIHLLLRSRTPTGSPGSVASGGAAHTSVASALTTAYLANVLNIKAAAVYLSLAPQFLPADRVGVATVLTLGAAHVALMAAWLGLWAAGLRVAHRRIDPRRWRRRLDRAGGVVLVALGMRTAVTR